MVTTTRLISPSVAGPTPSTIRVPHRTAITPTTPIRARTACAAQLMGRRAVPNGARHTTLIRALTHAAQRPQDIMEAPPWGRRTTPGPVPTAPHGRVRTPMASGGVRLSRRTTSGPRPNTPQPRRGRSAATRIPPAARRLRAGAPMALRPPARQPTTTCTQAGTAMCTRTPMAVGKNTITVRGLR